MKIIIESFIPADEQVEPITPSTPPITRGSFRARLREPLQNTLFRTGIVTLAFSVVVYGLSDLFLGQQRLQDLQFPLFMLHYGLTLFFSLILLVNGLFRWRSDAYPNQRPARWIGLVLWLISAFALNRCTPVFQQSTEWLCWAVVLAGASVTAYGWRDVLSIRGRQILYAGLAISWCLFTYQAIYIIELYPISALLIIGLGVSLHSFVPLVLSIAVGKRLWHDVQEETYLRPWIRLGLAIPVVAVGLFLFGWNFAVKRVKNAHAYALLRKTSDLPDWVLAAQQLENNWLTNRLLRSGWSFDKGRFFDGNWDMSSLTALDDVREHDPLVVIASRLYPLKNIPEDEQLQLLKVISNEKHGTEEKFWTGRHLRIQDVVSQVRIWPKFRLSYTEKTLRIRNQQRFGSEEALFTFHLPAGSVVSSMSLWVNGKEEPARLTTVAKADSAYRTVVKVESKVRARDPSVVYWQEGNRVTVRVFPCQAREDRQVKLGITSPLRFEEGDLIYQNPYFEGPDASLADELVNIDFAESPVGLDSPWLLDQLTGNTLAHEGKYKPSWQLRFKAPPVSTQPFALEGYAYQMAKFQPDSEQFTPADVYLDVNNAWKKDEFTTAFRVARQQYNSRVWVFDDGLRQLDSASLDKVYENLASQRFSLFPIYQIANPATSLLITKGTTSSLSLSDLKNSTFAERTKQMGNQSIPIRTFCYGNNLSTYLKTLAELQVLNVTKGTTSTLIYDLAKKHRFPRQPNRPDQIALPDAQVSIRKTPLAVQLAGSVHQAGIVSSASAPDHLARLFIYNHLLGQIGRNYFTNTHKTPALIAEAQQAHVVSPLSSLIVLETQNDYERFGIHKDKNGLDNATLKKDGAVPEPHEWTMLLMVAGLVCWLLIQKRRNTLAATTR
jgi:XrtN system VIT domain protein